MQRRPHTVSAPAAAGADLACCSGAAPAEGFAARHKRFTDNLAGAGLLSEVAAGGGTSGLTGSPQRCCAGGEKKSEGNQIWALWQAVAGALGLLPGPGSKAELHAKEE